MIEIDRDTGEIEIGNPNSKHPRVRGSRRRTQVRVSFLPDQLTWSKIIGTALLTILCFALTALASYKINDDSFPDTSIVNELSGLFKLD